MKQEELQKLIKEEIQKFLAENREEIVKRAEKRLRAKQRETSDGEKKLS